MVASKNRRAKTTIWRVDLGDKIVTVRAGSAMIAIKNDTDEVTEDVSYTDSEWQYYTTQTTEINDVQIISPDEFIIKYTYGKQSEYVMKGTVKGLTITWRLEDERE